MRIVNIYLVLLLFLLPNFLPLQAQGGYSSASVSSQQNAALQAIPEAKNIVVEEYMNFRKHQIPQPKGNTSVALDLRWANPSLENLQEEAVLQIGIATTAITDFSEMPPLNLSLIIDKSGSMEGNDKMGKVKSALKAFIQRLRPEDIVSVVMFDNKARLVIPAQKVKDLKMLSESIDNIEAGGGTNVEAGVRVAYQELLENYDSKRTNRALLLTDGLANVGELNPEAISSQPAQQNLIKNINLSAIGVGVEYNSDMLRQLVKSAGGQLHFVSDDADINKIFIEEVESLLFPIATQAELEIIYHKHLDIKRFFGYQPRFVGNTITVPLENFNAGLTQVCLARFGLQEKANAGKYTIEVRLRYYDLQKNKKVEQKQHVKLHYQPRSSSDNLLASNNSTQDYVLTYQQSEQQKLGSRLLDEEVKKNYLIAYFAQSLKDIARTYHANNPQQALAICKANLRVVEQLNISSEDTDFAPVVTVLEKYQKILQD